MSISTTDEVWTQVQLARHPQRPHTLDYVRVLCKEFVELHGDRRFGDDAAVVGGLGRFAGRTVVVVGHQKGSKTKENVYRNFGSPHPEGYRKALRLMQHAEKFRFPLLCFIDTQGASLDGEAEQRGQGQAISACLLVLAGLKTPIISTVIGEGGSGGALAIGLCDRLIMLEHTIYTVASPEACAAILWRDAARAPEAARALKITSADLRDLGIADEVVPEVTGGAHLDPEQTIADLAAVLQRHLQEIASLPIDDVLSRRYEKYRAIGMVSGNDHVHTTQELAALIAPGETFILVARLLCRLSPPPPLELSLRARERAADWVRPAALSAGL